MRKAVCAIAVSVACLQSIAKMVPSDMSMAMFRSARIKEPTVFKAKVAIAAWDSVSWQERGPMDIIRSSFLAVRVRPYNARTEQSSAGHFCYVKKSSEAGRIVADALRDGGIHSALVCLRYSDNPDYEGLCVMDEIEMLEEGMSNEITVKFSGTRIGIVKHPRFDLLKGKISASIRTQKKFFKKPVMRVVVLSEENGALTVRDCIMDEPNIKVLNESDTLARYTSTFGNANNEPPPYEQYIDEISKNQAEVSKAVFSNVTYEGIPLGSEEKRTISGLKTVHNFGYAKFDKDEKANVIGYRIEMWYRGVCVAVYDTIKPSMLSRYELPADWHVSFAHPEKFKYRSPDSSKIAVRQ